MSILRFVAVLVCFLFSAPVYAALHVSNRPASNLEVGYLPADGSVVDVNPPPLAWLDEKAATSWTVQIARGEDFSHPVVDQQDWPWLLYTHNKPLPPGEYSWRYRYVDKNGKPSSWSTVRHFAVPGSATLFARPSAEEIRRKIPGSHPRMFMTPEKLAPLSQAAVSGTTSALKLMREADASLKADLMREPRPWTGGKWNVEEWRAYLSQIGPAVSRMQTLAFAWRLTGRDKYGERARQHLLNFAAWDPAGPSSMKVNDEVGMPVLYSMARTYDWILPLLSEEDRVKVITAVRARGQETYARLRKKPYEQFVYNSHFGRMWHFLGEAGLAFYDEIPEAETWLNYATTIFYGWYPYWGDSDGG